MRHLTLTLLCCLFTLFGARGEEPAIRYVDAATLTLIGKALPTERLYNRIDTTRYHFPKRVGEYCYHSTGLAILFRTNSPIIQARWITSKRNASANMTAIGQKGLDLYIRRGDEWVFAGMGSPKMSKGDYSRHESTLVADMVEGEKECLLYLPLFDRLDSLEIGIAEGSGIEASENPFRHKIVVHGSSITHGLSAGRPGMTYTALLGRHTGLYCINLGFSGLCTMQPEFSAYLADVEADAFILDCFSNPSAELINERFDAFVDAIRRTHPDTPLIFLQTIVRETRSFSTRIEKFESDKMAASEAQIRERMKSDKNIYFVDPGNLLGTDHNSTTDGVHPTDLGFERMLNRIEPEIVKILKKYNIQ